MTTATIVIPAHNEGAIIRQVVEGILKLNLQNTTVLVVDDGSTDDTEEVLKGVHCSYLKQERGGKGAAMLAGARSSSADYIIFFDGDGQDEPQDLLNVIRFINSRPGSIVFGSRFLEESRRESGALKPLNQWGNKLVTRIINAAFGSDLTDSQTSIKVIPRATLLSLNISQKDFLVESAIVIQLLKRNHHIHEIPVTRRPREVGISKISDVFGGRFQFMLSFLAYVFHQRFMK